MVMQFPTAKHLSVHENTHNPQNIVICDKCGKTFRNKCRLKFHHRHDHSNEPKPEKIPEQCPLCNKWYSSKGSVSEHIKNMHTDNDVEHRCPTCGFISTTAKALKKHILYNHDVVRRHKCNLCEKAFKRPQDIKEHMATHTGEPLYTCVNCGKTFKSKANMFHHRRRFHRAEWMADRTKPPKEKYSRN
ncbi:zinc finger protein 69 homolog [Lucilia sericata]|uniref:zinc finger protein 69 homolog n=1 Tax=Lucilia sericata TaxID=13632 RepID=UPI0018A8404E|nr:zinc finger protein 69 homolog [Lucilia sericata]